MKAGAVVLEEILGLLAGPQSLTVDELARAANLRREEVKKALEDLSKAWLVHFDGHIATIDPGLEEILLSE